MVAPLSIKDFAALVEKARVMEKMKVEVETQHSHQQRVEGLSGSRHRHEERRKPYTRPYSQSQGSSESSSQQGRIQCISVEDRTRGMFALNSQASRGATIVARKVTSAEIAPPS